MSTLHLVPLVRFTCHLILITTIAVMVAACGHSQIGTSNTATTGSSSGLGTGSQLCGPRTFSTTPLQAASVTEEIVATSRGKSSNAAAGTYGFSAAMDFATCIASWGSTTNKAGLIELSIAPVSTITVDQLAFVINQFKNTGLFSEVHSKHP